MKLQELYKMANFLEVIQDIIGFIYKVKTSEFSKYDLDRSVIVDGIRNRRFERRSGLSPFLK